MFAQDPAQFCAGEIKYICQQLGRGIRIDRFVGVHPEGKNILVLSTIRAIWEFRGSHSGPYLAHYRSVAHPQDWIRPVAAAEGGVLLIKHLSSFGTFQSSYDASI